ncbi:hypothetical protein BH11BAC7_BH11BAC7_27630 [soil metagenome]
MLKNAFIEVAKKYSGNSNSIMELWSEIEAAYSGKKRHYHTLSHLGNLLNQLTVYKDQINDWDAMLFALFYHDVVYNALKQDNEEKSAELAEKRMNSLRVPADMIERCRKMILATKSHRPNPDYDTNFFMDADLSVLGEDWDAYSEYCQQVRKEFAIFPDLIYNPGRKKVLTNFLQMERIFKTEAFYEKYEANAKKNLAREISEILK